MVRRLPSRSRPTRRPSRSRSLGRHCRLTGRPHCPLTPFITPKFQRRTVLLSFPISWTLPVS